MCLGHEPSEADREWRGPGARSRADILSWGQRPLRGHSIHAVGLSEAQAGSSECLRREGCGNSTPPVPTPTLHT